MSTFLRPVVLLCLAIFLTPVLAADTPKPKAALAVTVTKPQLQQWNTTITATGPLAAWQEAVIAAEIGGQRIDQILVDVGDQVSKGQELARMAQETVQAELKQQEAKVAQAEASLEAARVNAKRARQLKSNNALPALQIDQYLTEEATAKANLQAQKAAMQSQQIRLGQTHILAVDDGVISARSVTLGTVVQAGSELFRLVRQNKVEWQAEVAARDFPQVQVSQKAHITLPNGEPVEGEVRAVSPTLDANTRTAKIYVTLPSGSPAKAGMFAQGEILTGANQALTLPHSAVILRDGNHFVFTLNKQGHDRSLDVVSQRPVRTGRRGEQRVEILEGLSADEQVVVSGGAFLNDGDTVQQVDATEAQP